MILTSFETPSICVDRRSAGYQVVAVATRPGDGAWSRSREDRVAEVAVLSLKCTPLESSMINVHCRVCIYSVGQSPSSATNTGVSDPAPETYGRGVALFRSYDYELPLDASKYASCTNSVVWSPSCDEICIWVGPDIRVLAVGPDRAVRGEPAEVTADEALQDKRIPPTKTQGGAICRLKVVTSAHIPGVTSLASHPSSGALLIGLGSQVAMYTWDLKLCRFIHIDSISAMQSIAFLSHAFNDGVKSSSLNPETSSEGFASVKLNAASQLSDDIYEFSNDDSTPSLKICVDGYCANQGPDLSVVFCSEWFALILYASDASALTPTESSLGEMPPCTRENSAATIRPVIASSGRLALTGAKILDAAAVASREAENYRLSMVFLVQGGNSPDEASVIVSNVEMNNRTYLTASIRCSSVIVLDFPVFNATMSPRLLVATLAACSTVDRKGHIFLVTQSEVICVGHIAENAKNQRRKQILQQPVILANCVSDLDFLHPRQSAQRTQPQINSQKIYGRISAKICASFLPQFASLLTAYDSSCEGVKDSFVYVSVYPLIVCSNGRPDEAQVNRPLYCAFSETCYIPRPRSVGNATLNKRRRCAALNSLRPDQSQDADALSRLSRSQSCYNEVMANEATEISEVFVGARLPFSVSSCGTNTKSFQAALDDSCAQLGLVVVRNCKDNVGVDESFLWIYGIVTAKWRCICLNGAHITFSHASISNSCIRAVRSMCWLGNSTVALVTDRDSATCFEIVSIRSHSRVNPTPSESYSDSWFGKSVKVHAPESHLCHVLYFSSANRSISNSSALSIDICGTVVFEGSFCAAIYSDRELWTLLGATFENRTSGYNFPSLFRTSSTMKQCRAHVESMSSHFVFHGYHSIQSVKHCVFGATDLAGENSTRLLPTCIKKIIIQPSLQGRCGNRLVSLDFVVMDCNQTLFLLNFDSGRQAYVASKCRVEQSLFDIFPLHRWEFIKGRHTFRRFVAMVSIRRSGDIISPTLALNDKLGISILHASRDAENEDAPYSDPDDSVSDGALPLMLYLDSIKSPKGYGEFQNLTCTVLKTGAFDTFGTPNFDSNEVQSLHDEPMHRDVEKGFYKSGSKLFAERTSLAACGIFDIAHEFLRVDPSKLPNSFIVEYERNLGELQSVFHLLLESPASLGVFVNCCESFLHSLIEADVPNHNGVPLSFAMRNMLCDKTSRLYFTFFGILGVLDQYLAVELVTRCARKLEPAHRRLMFPLPVIGGRAMHRAHPSAPFIIGFEEKELFDFCVQCGWINHAMRMLPVAIDAGIGKHGSPSSSLYVNKLLSQSLMCSRQLLHSCAVHLRLKRFFPELIAFISRIQSEVDAQPRANKSKSIAKTNELSTFSVWNTFDWMLSAFSESVQVDLEPSGDGDAHDASFDVLRLGAPGTVVRLLGSVVQKLFDSLKTLGCAFIALSLSTCLPQTLFVESMSSSLRKSCQYFLEKCEAMELLSWDHESAESKICDLVLRNSRIWSESTVAIVLSAVQMFDLSALSSEGAAVELAEFLSRIDILTRDRWLSSLPDQLVDLLFEAEVILLPGSVGLPRGPEVVLFEEDEPMTLYDSALASASVEISRPGLIGVCPSRAYFHAFESHSRITFPKTAQVKYSKLEPNSPIHLFGGMAFASLIADGLHDINGSPDLPLVMIALFSKLLPSEKLYQGLNKLGSRFASNSSQPADFEDFVKSFCSYFSTE